jgi:hypothetical protein
MLHIQLTRRTTLVLLTDDDPVLQSLPAELDDLAAGIAKAQHGPAILQLPHHHPQADASLSQRRAAALDRLLEPAPVLLQLDVGIRILPHRGQRLGDHAEEEELRREQDDVAGPRHGDPRLRGEEARGRVLDAAVRGRRRDDGLGADGEGPDGRLGRGRGQRQEVEVHLGRVALGHLRRRDPASEWDEALLIWVRTDYEAGARRTNVCDAGMRCEPGWESYLVLANVLPRPLPLGVWYVEQLASRLIPSQQDATLLECFPYRSHAVNVAVDMAVRVIRVRYEAVMRRRDVATGKDVSRRKG